MFKNPDVQKRFPAVNPQTHTNVWALYVCVHMCVCFLCESLFVLFLFGFLALPQLFLFRLFKNTDILLRKTLIGIIHIKC